MDYDNLPRHRLWMALSAIGAVGMPLGVVLLFLAIWIPFIGMQLALTGVLTGTTGFVSSMVALTWLSDDKELRTFVKLGPEGRAEVRREQRAALIQAQTARADQMLERIKREQEEEFRALGWDEDKGWDR